MTPIRGRASCRVHRAGQVDLQANDGYFETGPGYASMEA